MNKELDLKVKLSNTLGSFEREIRELLEDQDDIFSDKYVQTGDLLKLVIETRKKVNEIGAVFLPEDEFDISKIYEAIKQPE